MGLNSSIAESNVSNFDGSSRFNGHFPLNVVLLIHGIRVRFDQILLRLIGKAIQFAGQTSVQHDNHFFGLVIREG